MIRKEHWNKSPTSRLLSCSQRLSSTLTSFVSPRDSIRVMALILQLQQARIFEESSTQTRHLAWWQNGQIVPSVGEESSRCVTLISSLQKNGEVRIALKIELAHFTRSSAWCQEVTKRTVSSSQRREKGTNSAGNSSLLLSVINTKANCHLWTGENSGCNPTASAINDGRHVVCFLVLHLRSGGFIFHRCCC
jgi:hypothetical protein